MPFFGTIFAVVLGCAFDKERSAYDDLREYEESMSIFNKTSLVMWASQTDTSFLWRHQYLMRYDCYVATGNGAQKIHIWPEFDMITVFTGGNYDSYI